MIFLKALCVKGKIAGK